MPRLKPNPTHGQTHRYYRDLALFLAHRGGMSHRQLALAFVLARSRVASIIDEVARLDPAAAGRP